MGLTVKQQKFADEYIISGNAYQSAKKAGYSENYAKAQSSKLLENVGIKNYIGERLEQLKKESIAEQDEVMQYLTSIMRGEEKEKTLVGLGMGEQELRDIDVGAKDRIKAAELLGKRYGMWLDKQDISGSLEVVNIIDDIPDVPSDEDG